MNSGKDPNPLNQIIENENINKEISQKTTPQTNVTTSDSVTKITPSKSQEDENMTSSAGQKRTSRDAEIAALGGSENSSS